MAPTTVSNPTIYAEPLENNDINNDSQNINRQNGLEKVK